MSKSKELNKYKEKKTRLIKFMTDKKTPPLKFSDISVMLDVQQNEKSMLEDMLDEAVNDGVLVLSKRGLYSPSKTAGYKKGTYMSTKGEYGFIRPEEQGLEDLFVPPGMSTGAMNGDTVLYEKEKIGDNAKVIKIVTHAIVSFTGAVKRLNGIKYVTPLTSKIKGTFKVIDSQTAGIKDNDLVKVEITKYLNQYAEVKIIEKVGSADSNKQIVESIVRDFGIKREFPKQVGDNVERIINNLNSFGGNQRSDFRSITTVTIDGSDAKDLDDAISLEVLEDGNIRLYVHIADVSEYVTQYSPLDKEALRRGTSVYFPDDVIPMLPKELSNGICSLNPNEDRLTLSVVMVIDKTGKVLDHDVTESIIRSDKRMTYDEVQELINEAFVNYENDTIIKMVRDMYALYTVLKQRRIEKGAVNFDFPESKILLDKNYEPIDVKPYKLNESNGIIEEFMLICNETIAEHFGVMEIPFVFRIHEFPDPTDIKALASFVTLLGFKLKNINNIYSGALAQLVEDATGSDYEEMINTSVLRSMKKAVYSPVNIGHFGLASDYYCHFTSPIRRYPDLLIHRIIKSVINGTMDYDHIESLKEFVTNAANRSSETERAADELEREIISFYKCAYMKNHMGENFEGIISDINNAGIRVRLKNTITGIIFFRSMLDYYFVNKGSMEAVGEVTGHKYRVGDKIDVILVNVDIQERLIEFSTREKAPEYEM